MQRGFLVHLLRLLCCTADEGELRAFSGNNSGTIVDGSVRCVRCALEHPVRDGILFLLKPSALHPESAGEMELRDRKNESILAGTPEWTSPFAEATEEWPTLAAVGANTGAVVLELGCGTGRYTLSLAQQAEAVIAVDFSLAGLRVLRQKLDPSAPVGLVQADVTQPFTAPRVFDRALSTLHSNLPSRDHRVASVQRVAHGIKDDGRAVISMHHHGLRDVMLGVPAEGRYPDSGIYRYHMTKSEAQREMDPFFESLRFVHIAGSLPGIKGPGVVRAATRIPAIGSAIGRLFLAVCERPHRAL